MATDPFDLVAIALQPLHDRLSAAGSNLAGAQWSVGVLGSVEFAVVAAAMVGVAAAISNLDRSRQGLQERAHHVLVFAAAVVAAGTLAWIVRHPGPGIFSLFGRMDHLVVCASGGLVLARLPARNRKWMLPILSACLLVPHTGWIPFALVLAAGLLGFAAFKMPGLRTPGRMAFAQAGVLIGTVLVMWRLRSADPLVALTAIGLFGFVLMRQISFVVDARRGAPADLGSYLHYMLFYPAFFGAVEVYAEFSQRNGVGPVRFSYRRIALRLVAGSLQSWMAAQIPVSLQVALDLHGAAVLWPYMLVLFVRSSLYLMGLWNIIEGCAQLYGVQLRPNFVGILSCQNPSEFWHSWRATMTNWLIHYVYVPLGGNRQQRVRNILVTFTVSVLWHSLGVPFLGGAGSVRSFAPIAIWGLVNALAVIGFVSLRERGWCILPIETPRVIRGAGKVLLTACLGSITATFLSITPEMIDQFPPFLLTLVGLRR